MGSLVTDFGVLVPLSWHSFELVDVLNMRRKRPLTKMGLLKGVLIGTRNQVYEITMGDGGEMGDVEIFTPIIYDPRVGYGRSSDSTLDVLLSVGIEENCDPADIVVAANKLAQLNPRHYVIESYEAIVKNCEKVNFFPLDVYFRERELTQ